MTLLRQLVAEVVGTALLLAIVVGSGIMAARLSGGNDAVALLANTIATAAGLIVLIEVFGPVSGAHFNPAVTLAVWLRRETTVKLALLYVIAQLVGAVLGVLLAHAMFAEPLFQVSTKPRDGTGQVLAEAVATFGLIGAIFGTQRTRPQFTSTAVGLYIAAAYWFTASSSFANPAVTVARSLSDTFAGIALRSVPLFIVGQIAGTLTAVAFFAWLFQKDEQ
ncbi:MAG TPA: MIP/aquaporin family protein [Novosphingobium sp.]|nr:MIP/aquaporin family protein [Novosphingobium sp.]